MPTSTAADAVSPTEDGCLVAIDAKPGRRRTRFPAGYDAWRQRILIDLGAPARQNEANRALLEAAAEFFHVPVGSITLAEGPTHHLKRIRVRGVPANVAAARLTRALEAPVR